MNNQTAFILVAAAFAMMGFALGRVTAPSFHHGPGKMSPERILHLGDAGDIQMIVAQMEGEDFEGDTVIAIPGGTMHVVKNGDDIQVDVEMDVQGTKEGQWIQKSDEGQVIEKRIIITSED